MKNQSDPNRTEQNRTDSSKAAQTMTFRSLLSLFKFATSTPPPSPPPQNAEPAVPTDGDNNDNNVADGETTAKVEAAMLRIRDVKRELKSAHRGLERVCLGMRGDASLSLQGYVSLREDGSIGGCESWGADAELREEDVEVLIGWAIQDVWRGYRRVMRLEEIFRGREEQSRKEEEEEERMECHELSGARDEMRRWDRRVEELEEEEEEEEEGGVYVMSGALPVGQDIAEGDEDDNDDEEEEGEEEEEEEFPRRPLDSRIVATQIPPTHPDEPFNGMPSPPTMGSQHQDSAMIITNPEQIPQPREEVLLRIDFEETNENTYLHGPDRQRQGSCNGFLVADMVMCGMDDGRFVLPSLAYMKLHEVRALQAWLCGGNEGRVGYVCKKGTVSRTEKLLQGLWLLQTGLRFESVAVVFSRTPVQVREAWIEVMDGLLELHSFTTIEAWQQELYTSLWEVWKKYREDEDAAVAEGYYGYDRVDVAKVLVAVNLYIGRWREQGQFSLVGRSMRWGRDFGAEGMGRLLRADQATGLEPIVYGSVVEEDEAGAEEYTDDSVYGEEVAA